MSAIADRIVVRSSFTVRALIYTATVCLVATAVFLVHPDVDRHLTNLLRDETGLIPVASKLVGDTRIALRYAAVVFYLAAALLWLFALAKRRRVFGLYPAEWGYIVLCVVIGPLVFVDLLLKDLIGRPRPRMVAEFSEGLLYAKQWDFVGAFRAGGVCPTNCSFVSGEVSAAVMLFASLMFLSEKYRTALIVLMLLAWALSGYLRFVMMAHFPSDILFAGLYMVLVAGILHWLMFSVLRWQKLCVTEH